MGLFDSLKKLGEDLGKEIEKGIDELTGNKKKDTPKQQNNENVDIVNENENPIK